ncbi:MAG: leucine--tRNA ligase [Patescibacteria group bacterium]
MKYDHAKIEKKWTKIWEETKLNQVDLDKAKKPFYNLMMFPYPSAEGLHVGNVYAFVHSDAFGRFMKMQGHDVFEPIGLDGFGIHSENYAIKIKEHIKTVSQRTEKHFYEQLHMIGNQYDWSRTVETYKPNYYKWTQWLFSQMYKKGLAYRAQAPVNWCPSCKTVLSDEQVISGQCERCSTETEKRQMEQWFFKITAYAERLLKNLEWIDWSEPVKIGQRNWIGKSEGAQFKMRIITPSQSPSFEGGKEVGVMEVFTTRLDTVFGMTFALIAPEHEMVQKLKPQITNWDEVEKYIGETKKKSELQRISEVKNKTGVELEGIKIINPFTKKSIPLFASDFVLAHYGTGAVMAVPGHDQRDFDFAKKFNLPIDEVVKSITSPQPSPLKGEGEELKEAYVEDGVLINSGDFSSLTSEEARKKLTKWLEKEGIGKGTINYKLRDWCVSRQRYWGPPIPMIECIKCGWQPVPEKDLPVLLPEMDNFLPDGSGKGPLNKIKKFVETVCPKCGGPAKRETDVSDPFVDSGWYYLRYPSTDFDDKPFDKERLAKWLPVNMYIGGKEHTVLHLLYSRFITMVMYDLGYVKEEEPFKRFFAHGLLIKEGAKMSKSKGNIINPDEYIAKFGADSVRLYLMFLGDVRVGGDWRDSGMAGMCRFTNRVWHIAQAILKQDNKKTADKEVLKAAHNIIKKVGDDLAKLKFNTAIAAIMEGVNSFYEFEDAGKKIGADVVGILAQVIAPFAPHLAEELWDQTSHAESIFKEQWPEYDKNLIKEDTIQMPVQVNGKVRAVLTVPADISEDELKKLWVSDTNIIKWLEGREPKKVIFVKGRLVNIVV